MSERRNPYVGPRPFARSDRTFFFGRSREARDLLSLVLSERVVLFYAPSGAGKSSLLNARVIPDLEEEGFLVLRVRRLGAALPEWLDEAAVSNVFATIVMQDLLLQAVERGLMSKAGAARSRAELGTMTLADFLTRLLREEESPLIVLDQFEEVFTTYRERWKDVQGFFVQVRKALQAIPELGFLFTMREDYVAEMDPYAALLPYRMRARFRMDRLGREGALLAVKRPSEQAGRRFAPGVAEQLVDDLRRIRSLRGDGEATVLSPFVEPVQLQVVCRRLWESLPPEVEEIRAEDVARFGDVDEALREFYDEAVRYAVETSGVSEGRLRRWIDKNLITPLGTRGLVLRGEEETAGMPNVAVEALAKRRLVYAEVHSGARWYELAHDRLIDPVRQSNRDWEAANRPAWMLAARQWEERGRPSGLLYRGEALDEALAWARAHLDQVGRVERAFLQASRRAERRQRTRRLLIAAAVGLFLVALGFLSMMKSYTLREARARELAATSLRWREGNQTRALELALRAWETKEGLSPPARALFGELHVPEAEIALRRAVDNFYPASALTDTGIVYSMAYAPNGRYLLVGTAGGAWMWDDMLHHRLPIEGIDGPCWSVAFDETGELMAVTGRVDGEPVVAILQTDGTRLMRLYRGHEAVLYAVAFGPPGTVLSGDRNGQLHLWSLESGQLLAVDEVGTSLRGLAYEPRRRLVAAALGDHTVRLWSVEKPLFPTPSPPLSGLVEETGEGGSREEGESHGGGGAHGNTEEGGGKENGIGAGTVPTSTPTSAWLLTAVARLEGHTDSVNAVAFSPDGTELASASTDRTVRLWSVEEDFEPLTTFVGHTREVRSLTFSSNGYVLASGGRDGTVRLWNVLAQSSDALLTLNLHTTVVNALAFNPRRATLASGAADETIHLIDLTVPRDEHLSPLIGHRRAIITADYSPDGAFILSGDHGGHVMLWSVASGEMIYSATVAGIVWDARYTPDGTLIAVGANRLSLLDASTGQLVRTLEGHEAAVNRVVFTADGRRLVSASDDRTVRVWDCETWQPLLPPLEHDGAVYAMDVSPDGQWIVAGDTTGALSLWEAATGKLALRFQAHDAPVFDVVFSPQGDRLASGGWDDRLYLWSLDDLLRGDRQPLATVESDAGHVYSVAFGPDGRYLAAGLWDARAALWRLDEETRSHLELVGLYADHADVVNAVTFSPNGHFLATASWDRVIRRHPLPVDDLLSLARRYLQMEEALASEEP